MAEGLSALLKMKEGLTDLAFVIQITEGHPGLNGLITIPLGFWRLYFEVPEKIH